MTDDSLRLTLNLGSYSDLVFTGLFLSSLVVRILNSNPHTPESVNTIKSWIFGLFAGKERGNTGKVR